jgi:hypothetical protein
MFAGLNVIKRAWLDDENDLRAWRTEYGGWRSIKENEHKVSCWCYEELTTLPSP